MAFFSEIFFSTLIGKPVYTIDEEYCGQFRDFVVKRQNENFLITKVRIRVVKGDRIVVPWKDVHSIEADPVCLKLNKKAGDIKTMEYDDDELRLKRDFLDQQIVDTSAHRVVRVNDLKIVAVGDELFMVAADIGLRGLLRRLGLEQWALSVALIFRRSIQNVLLPSKYIDPFPARVRHDITLTVAQEEMKKMHPADLADILASLDSFERMTMLQTLPADIMADTVAELDPEVRKKIMSKLRDETVKKMLEKLEPDTASHIVSELPRHRMQHVLAKMNSSDAEAIKDILKYKKDTAGSIMNTDVVAFERTMTVGAVLEELRKKHEHAQHIFYIYLVDADGALKGVVSLRDLIFVDPRKSLKDIVRKRSVFVKNRDSIDEVIDKLTKYNLIALPVINSKKKLQGVITVDDVLPLLHEHA